MARVSNRTDVRINRSLLRWVLLGVGIIALLVALINWIAQGSTGSLTITWIALGVGVLGIAGFVIIDPASVASAITGRTAQQGTISVLTTIFFLAAILGGYYILYRLTTDGVVGDIVKPAQYKLHDTTVNMLKGLKQPVHVIGFVPRTGEASIRPWLQEYKRYGGDKFTYEFVDPD